MNTEHRLSKGVSGIVGALLVSATVGGEEQTVGLQGHETRTALDGPADTGGGSGLPARSDI
jgi:hypothetical protein